MSVLVDTSVWSLALRKDHNKLHQQEILHVNELTELINDARAKIIGPIRQELLSGIKVKSQFHRLRKYLAAFEDAIIVPKDYELAAELYNHCRQKGIQGSHIDFLICAVAMQHDFAILTTDKDFINYAKCVDIKLYQTVVLH